MKLTCATCRFWKPLKGKIHTALMDEEVKALGECDSFKVMSRDHLLILPENGMAVEVGYVNGRSFYKPPITGHAFGCVNHRKKPINRTKLKHEQQIRVGQQRGAGVGTESRPVGAMV